MFSCSTYTQPSGEGSFEDLEFDNRPASQEGWGVWTCYFSENGPYQICKNDADDVFDSDGEVWAWVVRKAREGSTYHRGALTYVRLYNPQEWAAIRKIHDLSFM